MKPIFAYLSSMVLLASAAPTLSDPPSPLPAKGDLALDRRAKLAPDRDTPSSYALEKRGTRRMTVPNHIGSAIQNIGAIVVKAIVDAAGELIFQITNNGASTFQVSLREVDTGLDAATLNVAGHHTINYDPLGGINPGDVISITTQG